MNLKLVIGNKNYSSWSMRAWLLLKHLRLDFEEISISLYVPDARARVQALGGETGLVPVLIADGFPIWDTLALTEFLHERYPGVWPESTFKRARARSYAGEVHSGLNALRDAMPLNCRGRRRIAVRSEAVVADIQRVTAIWSQYNESIWLLGEFCALDIMFAPVAARFRTYDVMLSGRAAAYQQRLLEHPLVKQWCSLGEVEPQIIEQFESPQSGSESG